MFARHKTYRLYRQTKIANLTVVAAMLISILAAAAPLLRGNKAAALPFGQSQLRLSSAAPATVQAGTGTTSFSVKEVIGLGGDGWTDVITGIKPATITANVTTGQIATDCAGPWATTAMVTIPAGLKTVEGTFCYRSDSTGTHTIALEADIPKPFLLGPIHNTLTAPVTVVDTTAPSVPVNGWPHNITLNSNVFDYTWSAATDVSTPVTYEYQAATNPTIVDGVITGGDIFWKNWEHAVNASQYPLFNPLIPSLGTSYGHWYWQVRAVDSHGNTSAWSEVWDYILEPANQGPTVTFNTPTTPASGALVKGTVTADVTAVDDYGMGSYYIRFWKGTFESGAENLVKNCQAAPGGNLLGTNVNTTCTFDTTTVPDGLYVISAQFLDSHSVWGSALRSIIVDNKKPTVNLTQPTDNAVTNGTFTILGTAADTNGIEKVEIYVGKRDNNGTFKGYVVNGALANWDGTTFTFDVAGLPELDGTYYVRAKVFDNAGNFQFVGADNLVVDTTAPLVTITVPAADALLRGVVNLAGTVDDAHPMNSYFRIEKADGTFIVDSLFADGRTLHEYSWNTVGLDDGEYKIFLEARDKANNKLGSRDAPNDSVAVISVTIDNTAPAVAIASYGQNDNEIQPNVTATDPSTPLTYSWAANPGNPSGVVFNDNVLNPVFTVTSSGTYAFELTVTDAAGNSTTVPFGFTYTVPVIESASTGTPESPTSTPLVDDGQGADDPEEESAAPQVLSTSTSEPGDVEGDNTTVIENAASTKNSNFLGLGWWWLAVLGALAIFWLLLFARRSTDER